MKRSEKREAQEMLTERVGRDGRVPALFESPAMIAKYGARRMTPEQYRQYRMGRGARDAEQAREIKLSHSRFRRMSRRS